MSTNPLRLVEKARSKKKNAKSPLDRYAKSLSMSMNKPAINTGAGPDGKVQPMNPSMQTPILGRMSQLHEGETAIGDKVLPAEQTLLQGNFGANREQANQANSQMLGRTPQYQYGTMPQYAFGTNDEGGHLGERESRHVETQQRPSQAPAPIPAPTTPTAPAPSAPAAPSMSGLSRSTAPTSMMQGPAPTPKPAPAPVVAAPKPAPALAATPAYSDEHDPYKSLEQFSEGTHKYYNQVQQQKMNDVNAAQRNNINIGLSRMSGQDMLTGSQNALQAGLYSNANAAQAQAQGEIGMNMANKMYDATKQQISEEQVAADRGNQAMGAVEEYALSFMDSSALMGMTEAQKLEALYNDPRYNDLKQQHEYYTSAGRGSEYTMEGTSSLLGRIAGNSRGDSVDSFNKGLGDAKGMNRSLESVLGDDAIVQDAARSLGMTSAYITDEDPNSPTYGQTIVNPDVLSHVESTYNEVNMTTPDRGVQAITGDIYKDEIESMYGGELTDEQNGYMQDWVRGQVDLDGTPITVLDNGELSGKPTGVVPWKDPETMYSQGWVTTDGLPIQSDETGSYVMVDDGNGGEKRIATENYYLDDKNEVNMDDFNNVWDTLQVEERTMWDNIDGDFDMSRIDEFMKYSSYDPDTHIPGSSENPFYTEGTDPDLITDEEQVNNWTDLDVDAQVNWDIISGQYTNSDNEMEDMVNDADGKLLTQDIRDALFTGVPEDQQGDYIVYRDTNGTFQKEKRTKASNEKQQKMYYQVSQLYNDGESLAIDEYRDLLKSGQFGFDGSGNLVTAANATGGGAGPSVDSWGDSTSDATSLVNRGPNFVSDVDAGITNGSIVPAKADEIPKVSGWTKDGMNRWALNEDASQWAKDNTGKVVTIDGNNYVVTGGNVANSTRKSDGKLVFQEVPSGDYVSYSQRKGISRDVNVPPTYNPFGVATNS